MLPDRFKSKNKFVFSSGTGIYNRAYLGTSNPNIYNCVFSNNLALSAGGCIFNDGYNGTCSPTITNCSFYNNTAGSFGGALANNGDNGTCSTTIKNCVFDNNKAASVSDHPYSEFYAIDASPTVSYSSLQRDSTTYTAANLNSLNSGTNNIYAQAPGFTSTSDLDGTDNTWRTADDGLMPASGSPLINAGTNSGAPSTDILGLGANGTRDIGAYEVGGTSIP